MAAAAHHNQAPPHPRHPGPASAPGPAPGPGPYRGPHAEEQQQHHQRAARPFFYMQPPQPYLQYQWPMPYNPYCGFPAMGYGMVPLLPPPPPPHPYVDGPSYIMPRTPLHLVDYRQVLNPQMGPAVAYQARRFRYHTTHPRVMINSEVQTEPLEAEGLSSTRSSTDDEPNGPARSESGRGTCCVSTSTSSASTNTSPLLHGLPAAVRIPDCSEPVVAAAPPQPQQQPTSSTPFVGTASSKTTTVFQDHVLFKAEEVQIQCSGTMADFQVAHREETAQLVSDPSGLLHCTTEAPGLMLEGAVQNLLPQLQPEKLKEGGDPAVSEVAAAPASSASEGNCLPPCPDILLMGASPSAGNGELLPTSLEGSAKKAKAATPNATPSVVNTASAGQAANVTVDHGSSMVVCADSTTASQDKPNEEPEMVGSDLFSNKNPECKVLHLPVDLQFGQVQHMETSVWSVESLMPYVPSRDWLMQNGLLSPHVEEPLSPVIEADADSLPEHQEPVVAAAESDLRDSMSSLPAYHMPSASWLSDFGNVYLYHKVQPNVQHQHQQQQLCGHGKNVKAGQHMSQSSETLSSRPVEESGRRRPRTGVASDLSDNERPPTSPQGEEGLLSPSPRHRQCVCGRSVTKRSGGVATSPTPSMKRLRPPPNSQQRDPAKSPGRGMCKCVHGSNRAKSFTKGSGSDVPGRLNDEEDTTEGEASENSLGSLMGVKRASAQKSMTSGHHSNKCPMAQRSKLREQNCSCDAPRCGHLFSWDRSGSGHSQLNEPGWERGFPFGHHSEERLPRRSLVYDSVPVKGPNNQKKPYSQSQGSHRKVSRC